MRVRPIFAVAVLLGLPSLATAQLASVEDYLRRMASVDAKKLSATDCTGRIATANSMTAADLFHASAICHALQKQVEGNFLLAAGQVRATADLGLMAPAAKADIDAMTALYGFLYYYAGGAGKEEVFRDAGARAKFLQLFDAWAPTYTASYSPDWNVGTRPDVVEYQRALTEAKAGRRRQLVDLSRLLSDERYYALHRQFSELHERNSGTFVEGTTEEKLLSDLQRSLSERAQELGINHGAPVDGTEEEVRETPPSAPGRGETVVSSSADPAVKKCSDWAERLALMTLSKIVRVVITTGSEWGVVWRADIATSDKPPEMSRFICSKYGTMHKSGDAVQHPPLP